MDIVCIYLIYLYYQETCNLLIEMARKYLDPSTIFQIEVRYLLFEINPFLFVVVRFNVSNPYNDSSEKEFSPDFSRCMEVWRYGGLNIKMLFYRLYL